MCPSDCTCIVLSRFARSSLYLCGGHYLTKGLLALECHLYVAAIFVPLDLKATSVYVRTDWVGSLPTVLVLASHTVSSFCAESCLAELAPFLLEFALDNPACDRTVGDTWTEAHLPLVNGYCVLRGLPRLSRIRHVTW